MLFLFLLNAVFLSCHLVRWGERVQLKIARCFGTQGRNMLAVNLYCLSPSLSMENWFLPVRKCQKTQNNFHSYTAVPEKQKCWNSRASATLAYASNYMLMCNWCPRIIYVLFCRVYWVAKYFSKYLKRGTRKSWFLGSGWPLQIIKI